MHFGLTPEQEMVAETVRTFVEVEIYPHEDEVERLGYVPHELGESIKQKVIDMGFYAPNFPEEVGGGGLDHLTFTLLERELGRGSMALTHFWGRPQNILMACEGEQRDEYLFPAVRGERMDALAMTEPDAGSDAAALTTTAEQDDTSFVLNGDKTLISNGGIADYYTVFAKTGEAPGTRGISAFVIDADTAGLEINERIEVIAPHPLARIRFNQCRIPKTQQIGSGGEGFKMAMATLDIFRSTVGAAALGFARHAMHEAFNRTKSRQMFGAPMSKLQLIQSKIGEMSLDIDASSLLIYRAAWTKDKGAEKITKEAAMAKLFATEAAQRVIDEAVQIFGGSGVVSGFPVEQLYREIRALRIYEGASEVQKLIIAAQTLRENK